MNKSNKKTRILLASIFGSGCMFKKAHVEQFVEKLGIIKTYKRFKAEQRYTSKKAKILEQRLTLHHLQHRSEGGKATIENGAVINELAHRYIHSLPRNQEEVINDYLREWKRQHYSKAEIELVDELDEEYDLELAEISVVDETIAFKKLSKEQKKQEYDKQKRKEKIEMQRLKKEYEDR